MDYVIDETDYQLDQGVSIIETLTPRYAPPSHQPFILTGYHFIRERQPVENCPKN